MGRIKALDPEVVHRIAAGEIIVSPANALKELLENSLDAGASSIEVVVKNGGHKLLQVTDNGQGIDPDDLEILCQRFTTSKISNFKDLETVNTLGFRGEALASISHIAHLSVRTKTKDARTASLVTYQDGRVVSSKKSAGVQGTQITVEDLFYNSPLRSQALQGDTANSSEYQKILDVVNKYSIQYPGTFSCKRYQDSQPVVVNGKTQLEKIRKIYGNPTAQALSEIELDPNVELGMKSARGYISGLNYESKRPSVFIFFINRRLVSCDPLARSIRKVYQDFMPRNSSNSFVYLSMELDYQNVDINVHPTKREVFFLHETEIITEVCEKIRTSLSSTENERDYRVQSYISTSVSDSGPNRDPQHQIVVPSSKGGTHTNSIPSVPATAQKSRYEYNLVRTDPHQSKLTSYLSKTSPVKVKVRSVPTTPRKKVKMSSYAFYSDDNSDEIERNDDESGFESEVGENNEKVNEHNDDSSVDQNNSGSEESEIEENVPRQRPETIANEIVSVVDDKCEDDDSEDHYEEEVNEEPSMSPLANQTSPSKKDRKSMSRSLPPSPVKSMAEQQPQKEYHDLNLASVNELLSDIKNRANMYLLYLFSEHTFVGIVDRKRSLAAIQVDVRLFLIEYLSVAKELFFQMSLQQLGNFGTAHLGDGIPITQVLALAPEVNQGSINFEILINMEQMLREYFQIVLREKHGQWCLVQLPVILPGYMFPISRIPQFVADLITKVDWSDEKICIEGVAKALSTLYLPTFASKTDDIRLIFDAAKTSFVPSRALVPGVVEIANLPGLYRVFERC